MSQHHLFRPYLAGDVTFPNRVVLAPMTRSRVLTGNVPNPLAAQYYAQRASAGLLITEGTQVSPQGVGYIRTPGIHTPAQVAGWKTITDAVQDRKSTRLNSSHGYISYAVFCLKKKKKTKYNTCTNDL